jgi:hypothetical protein
MKTGRPKANIDWKKVDGYLQAQCDGAAIAGLLGIHPDTLYKACEEAHKMTFSAYSQLKKSEGKELLRAKQFQIAMTGEKTMLVWLGKQYLGQSDKTEVSTSLNMTADTIKSEIEKRKKLLDKGK